MNLGTPVTDGSHGIQRVKEASTRDSRVLQFSLAFIKYHVFEKTKVNEFGS